MPEYYSNKENVFFDGLLNQGTLEQRKNTAVSQIYAAQAETQRVLGLSAENSKKFVAGSVLTNGVSNGIVPQKTWDALPPELRAVLKYGPKELDLNKKITTIKTVGTPVAIGGGLLIALGLGVAPVVAVPAALGVTAWWLLGLANDWNDVNHWGPQMQQQTAIQLYNIAEKAGKKEISTGNLPDTVDAKEIYNAYIQAGATGINNPITMQSQVFTEASVLAALKQIANYLIAGNVAASKKTILLMFNGWVLKPGGKISTALTTGATAQTRQATTIPTIKVFTGIVTQGKLGDPAAFVARETDLIDNMEELVAAAQNNLASFLVALSGRVVYEIKIVSSVTSKTGFVTRGTTQKIVSGRYANGQPKYKTIVNKFAQLNVYFVTSKGIKSKIETITLGPVNSATFTPDGTQIQLAENTIKSSIITNDVNEIQAIITPQAVVIEQPKENKILPTTKLDFSANTPALKQIVDTIPVRYFIAGGIGTQYFVAGVVNTINTPYGGTEVSRAAAIDAIEKTASVMRENRAAIARGERITGPTGNPEEFIKEQMENINKIPDPLVAEYVAPWGEKLSNVPLSYVRELEKGKEDTSDLPQSNNPNRCSVTTIAEYFDVNKTIFPNLEVRAKLYEKWGLGLAAYYTGTAEQNNKFLAETKRRGGC